MCAVSNFESRRERGELFAICMISLLVSNVPLQMAECLI